MDEIEISCGKFLDKQKKTRKHKIIVQIKRGVKYKFTPLLIYYKVSHIVLLGKFDESLISSM